MTDVEEHPDFGSAQHRASVFVRQQILSGAYPAGMRLKTEELAQALGLSRMPVRDALQQLHSEGLVEIRPNRGAVVTSLTPEDVVELFEIRAVLEGLAARQACERLDDEAFEDLRLYLQRMSNSSQDVQRWLELHENFHDVFLRYANKQRLAQQVRTSRRALMPYIRMYISVYQEFEVQDAEHEILIKISRRRNADLLESVMRDHVLSTAQGVFNFLQKQGNSAK